MEVLCHGSLHMSAIEAHQKEGNRTLTTTATTVDCSRNASGKHHAQGRRGRSGGGGGGGARRTGGRAGGGGGGGYMQGA